MADTTTFGNELDKLSQQIRNDINTKLDNLGKAAQEKIQQIRQQATNDEASETEKAKAFADIKELEKKAALIDIQKKQNLQSMQQQNAQKSSTQGASNATSGTTGNGVSTSV